MGDDTDLYVDALCELKESGYQDFQDIDIDAVDNRTCKERLDARRAQEEEEAEEEEEEKEEKEKKKEGKVVEGTVVVEGERKGMGGAAVEETEGKEQDLKPTPATATAATTTAPSPTTTSSTKTETTATAAAEPAGALVPNGGANTYYGAEPTIAEVTQGHGEKGVSPPPPLGSEAESELPQLHYYHPSEYSYVITDEKSNMGDAAFGTGTAGPGWIRIGTREAASDSNGHHHPGGIETVAQYPVGEQGSRAEGTATKPIPMSNQNPNPNPKLNLNLNPSPSLDSVPLASNDDAGFMGDISRPVSQREKDYLDKWREYLGRGDMYEELELQFLKRKGTYLERLRKQMETSRAGGPTNVTEVCVHIAFVFLFSPQ